MVRRRDACATKAVPNPLGSDAGRLGLDLGDEVVAELASGRVREQFCAAQSEFVRGDEITLLLQHSSLALDRQRGEVEVGVPADERLQRGFVALVLAFAKGGVPAPGQPLQIRIGKRQWRSGITLVKAKQLLVKPDGFERR